jgi:hypothetical protein
MRRLEISRENVWSSEKIMRGQEALRALAAQVQKSLEKTSRGHEPEPPIGLSTRRHDFVLKISGMIRKESQNPTLAGLVNSP